MSTIFADKFKNTSGGNPVQINQLRGIDTAGSVSVQGEGTATTNLQQGLAKCWINFNGSSTVAIRDSFNFTSLTDNGTGDYTQTFTSAFSNNDYGPACVTQDSENDTSNFTTSYAAIYRSATGLQTTNMRLGSGHASTRYDITGIFASVHGDQIRAFVLYCFNDFLIYRLS